MPCLQHIQFVTTSFTSQLPVKTAQGNSKCLNSAHWVAVIHRENIFCHSAKLHNNIINYKKIKCKNTTDQIQWEVFLTRYPGHQVVKWSMKILSNWVCTDFGSKIQDFFHTFFQNNNFFFQTQGYQMGVWYSP